MSVLERDVVLTGKDGGQMKKTPLSAILGPAAAAMEAAQAAQGAAVNAASAASGAAQAARTAQAAAEGRATMEQVNAAIAAAVLDSWGGSY